MEYSKRLRSARSDKGKQRKPRVSVPEKICSKCGVLKNSTCFYRNSRNACGLASICKECQSQYPRSYRPEYEISLESRECLCCGAVKPASEFYKRKTTKGGLYYYCKACHTEQGTSRRWATRDFINSLKSGKPCTDCGGSFPPHCMDYDHRDGSQNKIKDVAAMKTFSRDNVIREIEKCDLVCANCHRERTYQRSLNKE